MKELLHGSFFYAKKQKKYNNILSSKALTYQVISSKINSERSDYMESKFYSVEELSQKLDMHIDTIRRYIREGRINAIKFGRSYRIKEEELQRILEEGI